MSRPESVMVSRESEARRIDHSAVWIGRDDIDALRRDIDHQIFEKQRFNRDLLRICSLIRPDRVLEVGAGTGIDSYCLAAESDAEHHALDLAETSIELGRRIARLFQNPVTFHLGDALATSFESGSFDLVFHQGLLEHFEDPKPLLEENLRILRPGGILVVDVPQLYSLYTLLKRRRMKKGIWPWGWEREYTAAQMRDLPRGLPMELVRLSSWGYDFYSSILRWPWVKFQRRNRWRSSPPFRVLDRMHRRIVEPIWEFALGAIENRAGQHFMMNVTGIYRRTR